MHNFLRLFKPRPALLELDQGVWRDETSQGVIEVQVEGVSSEFILALLRNFDTDAIQIKLITTVDPCARTASSAWKSAHKINDTLIDARAAYLASLPLRKTTQTLQISFSETPKKLTRAQSYLFIMRDILFRTASSHNVKVYRGQTPLANAPSKCTTHKQIPCSSKTIPQLVHVIDGGFQLQHAIECKDYVVEVKAQLSYSAASPDEEQKISEILAQQCSPVEASSNLALLDAALFFKGIEPDEKIGVPLLNDSLEVVTLNPALHDILVTGQSGSGKRFLLNELTREALSLGQEVHVLSRFGTVARLADYHHATHINVAQIGGLDLLQMDTLAEIPQSSPLLLAWLAGLTQANEPRERMILECVLALSTPPQSLRKLVERLSQTDGAERLTEALQSFVTSPVLGPLFAAPPSIPNSKFCVYDFKELAERCSAQELVSISQTVLTALALTNKPLQIVIEDFSLVADMSWYRQIWSWRRRHGGKVALAAEFLTTENAQLLLPLFEIEIALAGAGSLQSALAGKEGWEPTTVQGEMSQMILTHSRGYPGPVRLTLVTDLASYEVLGTTKAMRLYRARGIARS